MAGKQPKRTQRPGVDEYGRTLLHYAAADGDAARVQDLIRAGPTRAPRMITVGRLSILRRKQFRPLPPLRSSNPVPTLTLATALETRPYSALSSARKARAG